jgi:uncharacterized protein
VGTKLAASIPRWWTLASSTACDHDRVRTPAASAFALVVMATACAAKPATSQMTHASVRFVSDQGTSGPTLQVSVADTFAERQRGLSGVKRLAADSGMAFVFAEPTSDTFWMKDTLIPLSVAFVRADGTIVAIREMTPCTADPCPTYGSPEPYTLAIEATPSWFITNHIRAGASATIEGPVGA